MMQGQMTVWFWCQQISSCLFAAVGTLKCRQGNRNRFIGETSITNDQVYFQLEVLIIAKVTLVLNNTHSSRDSSPDEDTLIPG
jgi:hypothetical protein